MLRSSILFYFMSSCSISQVAFGITKCSLNDFPMNRKQPCNYYRYSPVALLSSEARPISASELSITISANSLFVFTNNNSVAAYVPKGAVNLTGGPLGSDKYHMYRIGVRFNGYPNNTVFGGTLDGIGAPLSAVLQFYNNAYSDPTKHPDGILTIRWFVFVEGNTPNRKVEPFANRVLRNIRKLKDVATISAGDFLPWLLDSFSGPYLFYPGSFIEASGYQAPNDLFIVPGPHCRPYVSYPQFYEYFLKLTNSYGQPLVTTEPTFGLGYRPLVEVSGSVTKNYINNKRHKGD